MTVEPEREECADGRLSEEFALVSAATPEGTALIIVAVAHDHGMHVMVDNNLPPDALFDLLKSVVKNEQNS